MTILKRREFFRTIAVAAGGAALTAASPMAMAAEEDYRVFLSKNLPPARPAGKAEIVFTCPGGSSNGLDCTDEGLWTIDGAGSRTDTPGKCKVYLSSYSGKLLRELSPEGTGPSGIASDGKTLWIGSTYSREIIRVDATTGETIVKHFTPGAGVIYRMTTDPPARPDTYAQSIRAASGAPARGRGRGRGPQSGRAAATTGAPAPGTGAHELHVREGKLWFVVPPARMVYRVDPETWQVEHVIPTVGNRPHGIDFDGNYFWEADTNMGAFFKRDIQTGEVVDHLRIADGDPFPHGMGVRDGYIYWCSDVGGGKAPMCRVKIPGGSRSSKKS
jgi:sugar lactone lactonase YvrE